jgi:1,4-alpha-glucan branching enzyme
MTTIHTDGLVEFRFYRPNVQSVEVAGEFNDWQEGATSMDHQGDGWWVASLKLPAGEYRFRYVADGRWFTDYAAHGVEHDKQFGWNSVLLVPGEEESNAIKFAA